MAKKLGKLLLFIAGVASIATAVFYFLKKQDPTEDMRDDEDADDLEEETKTSRTYVPLNNGTAEAAHKTEEADTKEFTPLSDQVEKAASEEVEEFFDEDEVAAESPAL
jgi:hypothetical protein